MAPVMNVTRLAGQELAGDHSQTSFDRGSAIPKYGEFSERPSVVIMFLCRRCC